MEITNMRQKDKILVVEASRTEALGRESAVIWVPVTEDARLPQVKGVTILK